MHGVGYHGNDDSSLLTLSAAICLPLPKGDGLRSFLGEPKDEPSYFLSKLNFLNDTAILAGAM